MQLALYRAERPEVFDEIIGQKHIVKILQNQIMTGTVSQAYLFAGTHGTGKTSTARILAKAVNCTGFGEGDDPSARGTDARRIPPCGRCENCEAIREGRFPDVIELDAASNNGVDDLRSIIEMVKYPPSVGRYKVYIIDEVHMLSTAAENAFLKTLEEPPEHAIFILATTDPQKVRATIRSRCMQLNFRRVTEDELMEGMRRICVKRGISAADDALATIASRADGSVRDALSILEQCMAAGDMQLTRAAVLEYTGAAGEDFFLALTGAVLAGDAGKALVYIDEIAKRGKDTRQIMKDWLKHMRDLMIVRYVGKPGRIVGASDENIARLRAQADLADAAFIEKAIRLISEYINMGRYSERPRILLETAAVKLAAESGGGSAGAVPGARRGADPRVPGSVPIRHVGGAPQQAAAGRRAPQTQRSEAPMRSQVYARPDSEAASPETPSSAPDGGGFLEPGDPADMWDRILRGISTDESSFTSFMGRSSAGTEYDDGELTVTVSPGKLRFAEDKANDIARVAKSIYGPEVFVKLKAGDILKTGPAGSNAGISEAETTGIINKDIDQNEIIEDIQSLFGVTPTIDA